MGKVRATGKHDRIRRKFITTGGNGKSDQRKFNEIVPPCV